MRSYSFHVGYCELCHAPITAEVATRASSLASKNKRMPGIQNMERSRTKIYATLSARNQSMLENRERLVDELHSLGIALRQAWSEYRTELAWANRNKFTHYN